jgi:glycerate 2-kinase
VSTSSADPLSLLLRDCFAAGVRAARPDAALARALAAASPPPTARNCAVVSVGKAAGGLAKAMVDWLARSDAVPLAGVIVSSEQVTPPHPALRVLVGDHPIPHQRSEAAADAIGDVLASLPVDIDVHVAISGGTSSLIAGPLPGLSMDDVTATFSQLLSSGLAIDAMNAVRKRTTRWSAGRLAAAVAPRPVWGWLLSDVQGDDPAAIGSGPCSPDRWTASAVAQELRRIGALDALPPAVRAGLGNETLKPGDRVFDHVRVQIIADNATARDAAAAVARQRGARVHVDQAYLTGEAADEGRRLARLVRDAPASGETEVWVWGGETTVTITGKPGKGGRAQELALAAAQELDGADRDVELLAAGTDGRDGPTDAAGAIVDQRTWHRLSMSQGDGAEALRHHATYDALHAAGALLRTGPTGTNVTDLVIAARAGTRPAA